MKKSTFKILTVLLLTSVMGWAQQLQTTTGQTENTSQIQSISFDNTQQQQPMAAGTATLQGDGYNYQIMSTPQVITHSNSQAFSTASFCASGDFHYYRVFDLDDDFGITTDFQVSAAEFGVVFEQTNPVSDYPFTVNVYRSTGTFPNDTRALLATTNVMVPVASSGSVVSTPISATIPLGENLVYEIITNVQTAGDNYGVGQN